MAHVLLHQDLEASNFEDFFVFFITINMTEYALTELPVELILQILKGVDDLTTLVAVALTAHALNDVWRRNILTLSNPILLRTISCFKDAEELAAVQGLLEMQQLSTKPDAISGDHQQRASLRHCQRIRYNAYLASLACNQFLEYLIDAGFEGNVKKIYRKPAYLSTSERKRFHHAFYRVLTYLCLADVAPDGKERQSFLLDTSLAELWRLYEIACWLYDDYADSKRAKLGAGAGLRRSRESFDCYPFRKTDPTYEIRLKELMHAWTAKWETLGYPRKPRPNFGVDRVYYAIFDDWQDRLQELEPSDDKAREITASLRQRGFF